MYKSLIIVGAIIALLVPAAVFAAPKVMREVLQQRQIAAVRQATEKYHDVNVALADGYVPVGECAATPDGGMGQHYINPVLAADLESDPMRPELLLYAHSGNGLRLAGVEYFQADAGQPRPVILGQPFNGPMPGHEPGMPTHYDLHLWIWQANPDGAFAPWNPNISC